MTKTKVNIIYKLDSPFIAKREFHIGIEWDDIQHNGFAIFPDEMIDGIVDCDGFCDLELSEDGTKIVSFVAKELPDYMKEITEPSAQDDTDAMLVDLEYRLTMLELGFV